MTTKNLQISKKITIIKKNEKKIDHSTTLKIFEKDGSSDSYESKKISLTEDSSPTAAIRIKEDLPSLKSDSKNGDMIKLQKADDVRFFDYETDEQQHFSLSARSQKSNKSEKRMSMKYRKDQLKLPDIKPRRQSFSAKKRKSTMMATLKSPKKEENVKKSEIPVAQKPPKPDKHANKRKKIRSKSRGDNNTTAERPLNQSETQNTKPLDPNDTNEHKTEKSKQPVPRREPNPKIKVFKLRQKSAQSKNSSLQARSKSEQKSIETRIGYLRNIYKPPQYDKPVAKKSKEHN